MHIIGDKISCPAVGDGRIYFAFDKREVNSLPRIIAIDGFYLFSSQFLARNQPPHK